MKVTKRNGQLAEFDVEKIKKVISWACEGLEVNPLELEASFNKLFYDEIATTEIQDVLISEASKRTALQEPDWRYVAGRLTMMNIWKDAVVSREVAGYNREGYDFSQVVFHQIDNNRYDDAILAYYNVSELQRHGQLISADSDLEFDYAAAVKFRKRYLVKDELPQEALLMCALWLATRESPEKRDYYIEQFYWAFSKREISLATPLLINLRRPYGNLSSCFILAADNSLESIQSVIKDTATISKNGGGVGINLSRLSAVAGKNTQLLSPESHKKFSPIYIEDDLVSIMDNALGAVSDHFKVEKSITFCLDKIRAKGASIKNVPHVGGGVIPWIGIIDSYAQALTETRNSTPLLSVTLSAWHLDIEDFLTLNYNTGDQRRRVHYSTPKVVVPKALRERAANNEPWVLVDPHELSQIIEDIGPGFDPASELIQSHLLNLKNSGELKLAKVVSAKNLLERIEETFAQPANKASINRWVRVINQTAVAVNQLGKRSGAVTVSLDSWHLGIEEFLDIQTEKGDATQKAFDIFPQVVCSDLFMEAVQDEKDWLLVDPAEIKSTFGYDFVELWGNEFRTAYRHVWKEMHKLSNVKVVPAKAIAKKILRTQIETGMPYLTFKDAINSANPNKYEGVIPAGNLCQESFSNVKPGEESHVCNLVSQNMAQITEKTLERCTRLATRILDNAIDITTPPTELTQYHNQKYRTIGIGMMGLADWFAKHDVAYNKPQTIEMAEQLAEDIAYYSFDESCSLAKERGTFKAYASSEFARGRILCHGPEWFQKNSRSPQRWYHLFQRIEKYGIRNSQIQAIAPNTSSSLVQGCTASILPVFNKLFYDRGSNGAVPICPPFIKEKFWYYNEAKTIDPNHVIEITAAIQKWTDTGISMELLFDLNNPNHTIKYMRDTLLHAWESGCKTVYYIRFVQKDKATDECLTCAN